MNKKVAVLGVLCMALLATLAMGVFAKDAADYKMVLILPGPINDQSWNAANYSGLLAVNNDIGAAMEYVESVQASDFEATFRNYGERGYDLVLAAGTQFDDAALRVAPNYPNTTFTVVNGAVAQSPNVAPVLPKEYEGSYLAGLIAGYTTETGTIGIAGGFPNKLMIRLLNTYEYAARVGAPQVEAIRSYANSWSDVALGKQMASAMIDQGADVLFYYANQVGLGAIQACKESGAKFIGFASDQNSVAPGTVVASVFMDFGIMYKWVVQEFLDDTLEPVVNAVGIAEGLFHVSFSDAISPEVQAIVEEAEEAIANGTFLTFVSQFPESLE